MSPIRHNQRRIKDMIKKERQHHWLQYATASMAGIISIAILGVGLYSLNQTLSVKRWNIHAPAELKSNINVVLSHMEKMDFWHSRPSVLRVELLKNIPDLADVKIQRQLPDALEIHIIPRQTIALWLNPEQGSLYLVDQQGHAYRPIKHGETLNFPVLRMPKEMLPQACQWLVQLQTTQPYWFALSSEMFAMYDGWKVNLSSGQQWQLPFGQRAMDEIKQITKILKKPRWHAGNWRIDTRLENRWFLRPATHEGVI